MKLFPLPIPELERTDPCQYIPDVDDDYGYGQRMVDIFSMLKVTQGSKAGKKFGDDGVAVPWQLKFIRSLFGSCDENGVRDYTEAFLYIAKKNGKSSMAGPLAVAYSLAYPVKRGHIVIVSGSIKQASIIFEATAETIRADSALSPKFQIRDYKKDIIHLDTGSKIQILALAPESCVGVIPTAVFVDETHVVASKTGAKQLLEQLTSGMATTDNPFLLHTTTAPLNKATGVFSSLYARAKRVLRGEAPHDRFFPVLFELPVEKWSDKNYTKDSSNWWRCCPSIGFTMSKKWMEEAYETARLDVDPSSLFNFMSQHLNIIMGDQIGIDKFLPLSVWDKLADNAITLDFITSKSKEIYIGADLGGRDDPSALLVAGIIDDTMYCWSQQYLHRDGYKLRKEVVDYDDFIRSGELNIFDDENFDIDSMHNMVVSMYDTGKLAGVGVDPMGLKEFTENLEEMYPDLNIIGIPQGYKSTPLIYSTERKCYGGKIRHAGQPMMRFNIENACLKSHGEAVALIKKDDIQKSPYKIDSVIGLISCVSLWDDPEITSTAETQLFFI